jgi:putative transcriptional regulator
LIDKQTMRKFDDACLTPVRPLSPAEIHALREREGASQAVLPVTSTVTTGIVSQWERGEKNPQGASFKRANFSAGYHSHRQSHTNGDALLPFQGNRI